MEYDKAKALETMNQFQFFEQENLNSNEQRIFNIAFKMGYEKALAEAKIEYSKVSRYFSYGDGSGLSGCKVCGKTHYYECKCDLPDKMLEQEIVEARKKYLGGEL